MPGKLLGVVHRTAIVLMLMTTALWLALLSIVVAQWFAAGTEQWVLNYNAGEPEGARIYAEATRVVEMWEERLAQAIVAGPALLAVLSLAGGRRWLTWLCVCLLMLTGAVALLLYFRLNYNR